MVVVLAGWAAVRRRPWRLLLPAALSVGGIATYAMRGQPLTGGGQTLGDQWRELLALLAFVCVVTAIAMVRYRRTLD